MIPLIFASIIALEDVPLVENQNRPIEIRGFLHQMPSGEWVLSTLPHARSCCEANKTPQLMIKGQIPPHSKAKAVTLKGNIAQNGDHYILEL